jgi:hypothetical protein
MTKPNSPSSEFARLAPFSATNFPKAAKSNALEARNLLTISWFFSVLPMFSSGHIGIGDPNPNTVETVEMDSQYNIGSEELIHT